MEPHIVQEATKGPGKCLVSRDDAGPFIDTGCYAAHNNPYLYLSVRWVEEQATKLLGMIPRAQVEEELSRLDAELQEKTEKLAALEHLEAAVLALEEAQANAVEQLAGAAS